MIDVGKEMREGHWEVDRRQKCASYHGAVRGTKRDAERKLDETFLELHEERRCNQMGGIVYQRRKGGSWYVKYDVLPGPDEKRRQEMETVSGTKAGAKRVLRGLLKSMPEED